MAGRLHRNRCLGIPVRARAVGMGDPLQLSRPARQCAKARKVPLEVADFFQAERIECTQSGCHSCAQLLPCKWRVPIEGTDNAALMLATLAVLRESVRILRARLRSFCCRPRARAGVAAAAGAHHRALCRGRQRRADALARLTAQRLSDAFGRQFVVENRVGGNGIIAAEAVAHAPADGHTLLWGVLPPLAIQPALGKVPYDSLKDFAPISVVATNPFVLVVNKDLPVKTVAEFIAWVRAQPAKPSYAEGAVGSVTHLAMALFLHRAGIAMTNVSYRGNSPALTDIVAGHLPTMFSNLSDALPHLASGAIRALAVSSDKRSPQLPEVPHRCRVRLPRVQRDHLEWSGRAGRNAEADHRPARCRNRPRRQGSSIRRAPCEPGRRSPRRYARRVRGAHCR